MGDSVETSGREDGGRAEADTRADTREIAEGLELHSRPPKHGHLWASHSGEGDAEMVVPEGEEEVILGGGRKPAGRGVRTIYGGFGTDEVIGVERLETYGQYPEMGGSPENEDVPMEMKEEENETGCLFGEVCCLRQQLISLYDTGQRWYKRTSRSAWSKQGRRQLAIMIVIIGNWNWVQEIGCWCIENFSNKKEGRRE
uniref:Uncharacterized protein n=1 Tax=Chromera velia CCMP2878 TaxID=1169474 RepID=A0A0G4I8G0_9ALVE|eukprot:Cvel_11860.t1-p1 / transcript=Cvel_11860.t1 / gene=Cvel_11860 / organism=Chromera_velia_CCMP2878 / gene_product=hypothetical protein / transcript_product=hypothetical protein / location=Cvel_scaffold756:45501-49220(+) / protein_length=198 / sequence_SO=supercontig / SO=protein_coding / is_pseudo=false